jgi:hypothetical protein
VARMLQDITNTIYDTFLICILMLWFGNFVI